ncbi:MAG: MFS transporter [Rhodanobacteraceae bacterium]
MLDRFARHCIMLSSIRTVASLLLSTILLLLGVGLLNTLIPLRGQELGFSVTLLGALTSVYYVGYFIGTFTLPPLIHRIGHIRAFAFCTALVAALVLLQAIGSAYWLWLVLRIVQGLALVGLYAIIESWLNVAAEPTHRNAVFSVYMMLNLGSLALAQQFLRIQGEAFVLFSVVAILVCVAILPVATTRQLQPQIKSIPKLNVGRLYRLVPTALAGALFSGLTMGALWGLLPLYARAIDFAPSDIGTYMSIAILGGAVLQWPLGRLSDRHDRRLALAIISAAAAAVALAILVVPADNHALAMTLIFAFGGMIFAIYPIAMAHLVDYLPREELLSASSSVLLVNGIGSALGPLLAGALMNVLQPWLLFVWFASLNGLLASYALYRFARRKRSPTDDNSFVPMVRTSPVALDMHPDAEVVQND